MLGLANGIGRVGEVISAPEQAGAGGLGLARPVIGVANARRIGGFMNDADDALPLHQFEVDLHQIVMRHVHHGIGHGEERHWPGENEGQDTSSKKFHRADDNWRVPADKRKAVTVVLR
jgi:hypothetical protein